MTSGATSESHCARFKFQTGGPHGVGRFFENSYALVLILKSHFQTWNLFDLPNNMELARFFSTLSKEEMAKFEQCVFVDGQDPKTYIKMHKMVESTATIALSEEIENKRTILVAEPNRGGVSGHEGEMASTS